VRSDGKTEVNSVASARITRQFGALINLAKLVFKELKHHEKIHSGESSGQFERRLSVSG